MLPVRGESAYIQISRFPPVDYNVNHTHLSHTRKRSHFSQNAGSQISHDTPTSQLSRFTFERHVPRAHRQCAKEICVTKLYKSVKRHA